MNRTDSVKRHSTSLWSEFRSTPFCLVQIYTGQDCIVSVDKTIYNGYVSSTVTGRCAHRSRSSCHASTLSHTLTQTNDHMKTHARTNTYVRGERYVISHPLQHPTRLKLHSTPFRECQRWDSNYPHVTKYLSGTIRALRHAWAPSTLDVLFKLVNLCYLHR